MTRIITLPIIAMAFYFFDVASNFDIWAALDKYGFPTVFLALAIWFIWNRQKKADIDRNDLISRNNDLTRELITAVKVGNECKFEK